MLPSTRKRCAALEVAGYQSHTQRYCKVDGAGGIETICLTLHDYYVCFEHIALCTRSNYISAREIFHQEVMEDEA